MSTRKRGRPSLNPHDDEDELSPSKPNSAPLSTIKKRKLNTYGSKSRGSTVFGKFMSTFGFGRSEKENVSAAEEKDELADGDAESDDGKQAADIWEVSDEEEPGSKTRGGRANGTPSTAGKGTPRFQGKGQTGSAKSERNGSAKISKKGTYEVGDSDEVVAVNSSARANRNVNLTPQIPKSARKSRKEDEDAGTPKRGRGRPPKQIDDISVPSPMKSPGRPSKVESLKKAQSLSMEAIFRQLAENGRKAAENADEDKQTSTRRRSARSHAEPNEIDDGYAQTTTHTLQRPKNNTRESITEPRRGILTPTKNRPLKSRKSVAFEDVDLGFKDLPDSAKTSTSKKGRKSNELLYEDEEEPKTTVSGKGKKQIVSVEITSQPEEEEEKREDSDDEPCAVCKGLKSRKGNQIILCDGCDFAAHQKCYDLPEIPDGDWFCRTCQPVENDDPCAVCKGLVSKKGNEIIFCESCDLAVHQKCYEVPKIPQGEWFCRDCQHDENEGPLALEMDDDVAVGEVFNDLPEIEGLEDHLRHMQRVLLDRLTGQKRIKLRGHDEELRKVHQVIEQTVLAGEGNSMLVIGARGCGKTTLVESVISGLSIDHRENFHVVRLNGFIHTDDKLALKEIWRQLGREMDAEDEMTGKANHADTLASLLALLSHPSEISEDRADETAKSVVFVLDEFDLFTTHPRQTLLYNLFDIAQARKAPIVVLGLTTRIDVVETLEKRVKSRFSHRYVHLSLARSLPTFWEICKEGLLVETEDLGNEGFDLGISGQEEFISFWQSMIENLYNKDAAFKLYLQSHFYRSKSVPAFFTSCILPVANISARNLPLTGRNFTTNAISLSAPDSKLHILQGLSELELALLIAAARLDIILDTDTCNFAMAYDEYSSLTSRHKIQTSSAGVTALGASAKVWARDVALGAWERLAEYELLVPTGIGGGSAKDFGAGGRMWKVDVGLEEITGSVDSLSEVMAKWCREI